MRPGDGVGHLRGGPQLPKFVRDVGMLAGEGFEIRRRAAALLDHQVIEQGSEPFVAIGGHEVFLGEPGA